MRAEGVSFNHAVEMLKRDYFPSTAKAEARTAGKFHDGETAPLIEHTATTSDCWKRW